MIYNLYINQVKSLEWGIKYQHAAVFSFLYELPSWAESITLEDGVYYWASPEVFVDELPMISDKADTFYRIVNFLIKKKLVERFKYGKKDYYRVTAKGKTWNKTDEVGNISEEGKEIREPEKNPKVGNKSGVARKNIRKSPEIFPTDNNTSNTNTKIKKTSSFDAAHQPPDSDSENQFIQSSNGKLKWTPDDMVAAEFMLTHAERVTGRQKPKRPKTLESFANDFRVFREQENLGLTEIFKPIHWALKAKDPFWRTTIQSPSGLRKNFDQVSAKMLEDKTTNTTGGAAHDRSDDEAVENYLRNLQAECEDASGSECLEGDFTTV